ncbi:MAG: type II toxin-antitoxin system VapC family toxin [Treponema sp.]|nr:type II toxin-antitoxin system VapC family toxin [Treponema sp.]MBR6297598.1 type II toxin-antitoxin system VapC family toxin [Treponema sp.]MEE3313242.1 type II toxin-antitoxin system VapC family toxin [Treponema sp.]
MIYCLDTNVVIDATNNKKIAHIVLSHFKKVTASDIIIPAIVIAELEFGARHSTDYDRNMKVVKEFLKDFKVIPFTEKEAEFYGRIRQQLTLDGTPIGSNDMLIAATALAHDTTIVTHNVSEFSRVKDLKIEDWTVEY